jgi:hypothetical protein
MAQKILVMEYGHEDLSEGRGAGRDIQWFTFHCSIISGVKVFLVGLGWWGGCALL